MPVKERANKYKTVKMLEPGAISVRTLAARLNVSTSHVYKMYKNRQLQARGWDIVMYEGYNFAVAESRR